MANKLFRDPVHGYIEVPDVYVYHFVNTRVFQRLKRIEQTSIRVLYPGARHDRFIHSLGVFHIGRLIFRNILDNTKTYNKKLYDKLGTSWESIEKAYAVACLMHDCGHAPFSHTLETRYYTEKNPKNNQRGSTPSANDPIKLNTDLVNLVSSYDKDFEKDFYSPKPGFNAPKQVNNASAHEKMSAYVLLRLYKDALMELLSSDFDRALCARMITGCLFTDHEKLLKDQHMQLRNCFIQLLNGYPIEADRLDYIMRDPWASGVDNSRVDLVRLLSGMMLVEDDNNVIRQVYLGKSASVIESALRAKEFIYQWIHTHPIVKYNAELLCNLVTRCKKDFPFSFESIFLEENNHKCYLVDDGILSSILKTKKQAIIQEYFNEWFHREYRAFAIWKTRAEFYNYFHAFLEETGIISDVLRTHIEEFLKEKLPEDQKHLCRTVSVKAGKKLIHRDSIMLYINGSLIDYSAVHNVEKEESSPFFYAFYPKQNINDKESIVKLRQTLIQQIKNNILDDQNIAKMKENQQLIKIS